MKRAIVTSLILFTVLMSPTSAGAHEFLASSTGKTTIKLLTTSVFRNVAGTMECTAASLLAGAVTTIKSTTLTATFQFEKCKAFGLTMTISPVNVRSTADGGISLLKTVTAKTLQCLITIPLFGNQNLNTVKYRNTNKQIEKVATVSHVTSSGTGTACEYATDGSGIVTGSALVGLIGGTIDWQ